MNEKRSIQSRPTESAALPPELKRILTDLQSPDATTRACAVRTLCPCRGVPWGVPVFRYVWAMRNDPNPIVRRAVRHDLKENPWWSERHETHPPVGPHPRAVKLTLALKGMALSDLCDRLRTETGVPLVAEPGVADDKVTLLCERTPLRDLIRHLSRALEYAWVWKQRKGIYRYELVRDPRAPRPKELRDRDRQEGIPAPAWEISGSRTISFPPKNAATHAKLARDRAMRRRVDVPRSGWSGEVNSRARVTSADVLEALHQATGMPIIADFYTRLIDSEEVTARGQTLFDVLNHLADAMRLRWWKDGDWLHFRSATFYYDRLQEVPSRLLARWAASRRQHGMLTLDDLIEIAGLPDAQLDASGMAEGARDRWGLAEWDLARNKRLRPHLRYLASFTLDQRRNALSPNGLAFTRMSLAQQHQFVALAQASDDHPNGWLKELDGATLRVEYTMPGGFEAQIAATERDLAIAYLAGTSNARGIRVISSRHDVVNGAAG
jgi:hypothetical protein